MPEEENKEQREARLKKAEALKEEGNKVFKAAMKEQSVEGYHAAKEKYILAFHLLRQRLPQYQTDPEQLKSYVALHSMIASNLSQVSLKLQDYKAAMSQANAGLSLCAPGHPQFEKLMYRLSCSYEGQKKFEEALKILGNIKDTKDKKIKDLIERDIKNIAKKMEKEEKKVDAELRKGFEQAKKCPVAHEKKKTAGRCPVTGLSSKGGPSTHTSEGNNKMLLYGVLGAAAIVGGYLLAKKLSK